MDLRCYLSLCSLRNEPSNHLELTIWGGDVRAFANTAEGRTKGPLAPMYWGIIAGVSLALLVLAIASRTASSEEKGEGRWEEEEEDRGIDTDANRTMDESDDGWCNYNVIDCTAGPVLAR